MKKIVAFKSVVIFVFIFCIVILLVLNAHHDSVSSTFHSVERQVLRSAIENRIGKPDSVDACGEYLWWNGDEEHPTKNNGECVVWVRYNFFMEAYAFGYSSSGELVSKYRYVSE